MVRLRRKDIDFKYNLKLYWGLLRNYKVLLVGALFLILVLESTFVLDKFLFKIIVDKGGEFAGGSLLKGDFVNILLIVFGVYAGISIFRAIGDFTKIHLVNILDAHLIIDLKRKFFNHIISLDHEFHTTNKTGSLISRLVRGGGAIESMT
ncbi:MAG: ABC transporter transmembrane domain-containing protein, partial [Candidatus Nanoarchaeia archaeon]